MPIGKPQFDTRPGVTAAATARLWIVAMICGFQYWLLAASMEAVHAGNKAIALPALLGSLLCLALAVGLVLTGELGAYNVAKELRDQRTPPRDS